MLAEKIYGSYLHARPNGSVFYVGKGDVIRSRLLGDSRNSYHKNVINKHGKSNILVGFTPCSSEAIAFELEVGLIKCLKRMGVSLTNMTDGGDGVSGLVCSKSTRAKLAIASKGNKHGLGYIHTDDAKARMSISRLGNKNSEGNIVSKEARAKRAASLTGNTNALGHIQTEEHKAKISKANKGRQFCLGNKLTDKHKAAVAHGLRGNTNVRGYKWITNGVVSSLVQPGIDMPKGFKFGRKLIKGVPS